MKYAAMVAVLLSVCACSAFAGDGQISKSVLAEMGLSGLQVMSDADGMAIRGKLHLGGEATVWGTANSDIGGGTNANANYFASDVGPGADFAIGAALALSGSGPPIHIHGSFAGSFAYAGP